jgi:hypothetical protein
MNELQFLTKDQINGILDSLVKDVIFPQIKEKINLVKESDKYKENYNIIVDIFTKANDLAKQLKVLNISNYYNTSLDPDRMNEKTLESLNIRSAYSIKNDILNDLRPRLQLIAPDNFDTIITNMKQYIDIDKYLYNEVKEKEQDIDYDEED